MWTELQFYQGMCTTINGTQIKLLSNVLRYWTEICTRQTIQHNNELIKKNSVHGQQSSSLLIPWNFYILIMRRKKHNLWVNTLYNVNHVLSGLPRHTDIKDHGYQHTLQTPKRIPPRLGLRLHFSDRTSSHSCQQTYRLGFAGLF